MSEPTVVHVVPVANPVILRELAALIASREPDRAGSARARQSLSPEKLTELADMLLAGQRPTVGWWRRAFAASEAGRAVADADLARLRAEWEQTQ